jgi:hypothetical protein
MHLPGLIVEVDFPQELHVFDIALREDLLVFLPGRPLLVSAVRQPVSAVAQAANEEECSKPDESSMQIHQSNLLNISHVAAGVQAPACIGLTPTSIVTFQC